MKDPERVTVRMPGEAYELMQQLIDGDKYESVSDVIRAAVDDFLAKRFTPENVEKVTVDLPKTKVLELESLVRDGDSISLDDAIRNAVREYTRARSNNAR